MIIVGLGNPGKEFKNTRHNIGFEVLDKIKEMNNFPDFTFSKKFDAQISEGILNQEKTILAKPQTFMNSSGKSVKALMQYYKKAKLIIVHDDIDIPLKQFKVVESGGSAGHKGVQSIIDVMKTKNFKRIRIGILPEKGKPLETEKFVLKRFTKKEKGIIKETVKKTVEEISQILKHEISNS